MVWIDTTNHVQLYDVEPYVSQAADALITWLRLHLTTTVASEPATGL